MNIKFRKLFTTVTLLLVLSFSAFVTIPAYADESTPEAPVSEETAEVTEPTSPEEEAPPSDIQPDSEPETSDSAQTVESILESLPEDTQLIVLDEAGEALPLATEEAAQAIIIGDPIWCPASVTTPGLNGCSASYATFAALLADPIFAGGGPANDGVIWIDKTYAGEGATVTIDGAVLTVMKDFKLTLKGGWNGVGTNTIDTNDKSVFNAPLIITGWNNDVTISDIAVQNSVVAVPNSLQITTTGNITVNRVSVNNNTQGGAFFANSGASAPKKVTVTDGNFSNNGTSGTVGLQILSVGVVTLKNITADGNGAATFGDGIQINNSFATTAQAVTLINVSANNNRGTGVLVNSNGVITVTDMTATNNGAGGILGNGAELKNDFGGFSSGITLTGANVFSSNFWTGLNATSNGAIKASNLHAVDNGLFGALLDNDGATTPQPVTLTGTSEFKFNFLSGLRIVSDGQVSLNNITANFNNGDGVSVDNSGGPTTSGVTFTGTNQFISNNGHGLGIYSSGAITLNAITAVNNSINGVDIDNTAVIGLKGVTISGVNVFSENTGYGIRIISSGAITLSNMTANLNQGLYGAYLDNTLSSTSTPKSVTLSGTNVISNNRDQGLQILTYGAITLNNVSATGNGFGAFSGGGASLINNGATTPANVTINGTNNFSGNYGTGLYINTKGHIKINNLTANYSQVGQGAGLTATSLGNVTLTGTNTLSNNFLDNLSISAVGVISISNLTANNSLNGYGAFISNTIATSAKSVSLSGVNNLNNNWDTGLYVASKGAITLNSVTANGNGAGMSGAGAVIDNTLAATPQSVTLNGTNSFSSNYSGGLSVASKGNIKANNLTANGNYGAASVGASFSTLSGTSGSVTLTGTNVFTYNNGDNLQIFARGVIVTNNITASDSTNGYGAQIDNNYDVNAPKTITLNGVNTFNNNYNRGLSVNSYGAITVNNVTAMANGVASNNYGVFLSNNGALPTKPAAITIKGNNVFGNNGSANLYVTSLGAITANNVSAHSSVNSFGALLDNAAGNAAVTLTGSNSFYYNFSSGLVVITKGAITVSNLTASNNGGLAAVILDNTASTSASPKPVTLNGYVELHNNSATYALTIETYGAVITNNFNVTGNVNGVYVDQNPSTASTPTNYTMKGVNKFISNSSVGFSAQSLGVVTLNSVTASQNFMGASINTAFTGSVGNVILSGSNIFSNNSSAGLQIQAAGTVTVNNITANNNASMGAEIYNTFLGFTNPKAVKFTGTNYFNNNGSSGLYVASHGAVTLNNINANENTSNGVYVNGSFADNNTAHVTLTGKNQINNNGSINIFVLTKGGITISNLTANSSSAGQGAYLYNDYAGTTNGVTISGTNSFSENALGGLVIFSNGAISMTKITADGSANGSGITAVTDGAITLTCASVTNNINGYGVNLSTPLTGTLTGLVGAGNTFGNTFLGGGGTYTQVYGCPLP
jgi:hypothetical protein